MIKIGFILIAALLPSTQNAYSSETLFVWDRYKEELEGRGISLASELTIEAINTLQGGLKNSGFLLANLDLSAEIDASKLGWAEDATLFVYILGNYGAKPTEFIGDLQATSNIEAPNTIKIYELWWQQQFSNRDFSWLFGLHDFNSVYDALDSSGLFNNSSFGISPDLSQVPPSIFPTTSLSLMLSYQNEHGHYVSSSIYDGIPGSESSEKGTHIELGVNDGLFSVLEIGSQNYDTGFYKIALGAWYRTTDFEDPILGEVKPNNFGLYAIAEVEILHGQKMFVQLGKASANRNQIGQYFGIGWVMENLFLADDHFGLAFGYAKNSAPFLAQNPLLHATEKVFEISYLVKVNPWLSIQPDLQQVINPSMDPNISDALVFGVRFYLTL